jgi:hypothetical protein
MNKLRIDAMKLKQETRLAEIAASSKDGLKQMMAERRRQDQLAREKFNSVRLRWMKAIRRVIVQNEVAKVRVRLGFDNELLPVPAAKVAVAKSTKSVPVSKSVVSLDAAIDDVNTASQSKKWSPSAKEKEISAFEKKKAAILPTIKVHPIYPSNSSLQALHKLPSSSALNAYGYQSSQSSAGLPEVNSSLLLRPLTSAGLNGLGANFANTGRKKRLIGSVTRRSFGEDSYVAFPSPTNASSTRSLDALPAILLN